MFFLILASIWGCCSAIALWTNWRASEAFAAAPGGRSSEIIWRAIRGPLELLSLLRIASKENVRFSEAAVRRNRRIFQSAMRGTSDF